MFFERYRSNDFIPPLSVSLSRGSCMHFASNARNADIKGHSAVCAKPPFEADSSNVQARCRLFLFLPVDVSNPPRNVTSIDVCRFTSIAADVCARARIMQRGKLEPFLQTVKATCIDLTDVNNEIIACAISQCRGAWLESLEISDLRHDARKNAPV